MRNKKVLYMTNKPPVINTTEELKDKTPETPFPPFISKSFIDAMNDEVFSVFCSLDRDFKMDEDTMKHIKMRMQRQGISYSIDINTKTVSTNGKK